MVEYGGKVLCVPFRGDRIRSREAVSHRGRVFGLYRSAMFVFAPALVSTTLEMTGRWSVSCCLILSAIADIPT